MAELKSKNELIQNIAVFFIAIILFLILFEVFLNVTAKTEKQMNVDFDHFCVYKEDALTDYSLENNFEKILINRIYEIYIKTNSIGLRENDEVNPQKDDGVNRVFFLGDSFVFGYGVDQNKTIPFFLEEKLNEKFPERKFEVLNMGVPGYDFSKENLYFDRFTSYAPDVVLIGANITDFDLDVKDQCQRVNVYKCIVRLDECNEPSSTSFMDEYLGGLKSYNFVTEKTTAFFSAEKFEKEWEIEKKSLEELIDKLKSNNTKAAIVIMPLHAILENESFVKQRHMLIADVAKSKSIPVIDLSDSIAQKNNETSLYIPIDEHLNTLGTEFAAQEIANNWGLIGG